MATYHVLLTVEESDTQVIEAKLKQTFGDEALILLVNGVRDINAELAVALDALRDRATAKAPPKLHDALDPVERWR
jgi:hypothetical protein